MLGAAGIAQIPLQPGQAVFDQGDAGQALLRGHGGLGRVGRIQQQHQGRCQLFGGAPLGLALEGVPLAIGDGQQLMQLGGAGSAVLGPTGWLRRLGPLRNHWTGGGGWPHPGAMAKARRSPTQRPLAQPIRWLHQLAGLMAEVSRAERLGAGDSSLTSRRLRQRMLLAQRLFDPLPKPLRANRWPEEVVWTALRWGGPALVLALWLHR